MDATEQMGTCKASLGKRAKQNSAGTEEKTVDVDTEELQMRTNILRIRTKQMNFVKEVQGIKAWKKKSSALGRSM